MEKISENLSARTLFHFTTELKYLIQILEFNLRPRYCLEDTSWATSDKINKIEMAYPMVCFCDIPLSKIKKHLTTYGNYGIGLKKEWGFKKSLTPIIYSRKNAKTSRIVEELINWYTKNGEPNDLKYIISDIIMYMKPYYGKMYRNSEYKKTRFYDEREWRWIPEINRPDLKMHLEMQEYLDLEHKEKENKRIGKYYTLDFKPNDIKYLILNDDSEIDTFITKLEAIKGKYSPTTIKKLTTRILTTEQIKYDF